MATSKDISVECGDRAYRGSYRLAGEMVYVDGAYGTACAQLNDLQNAPEPLAQLLLYGLAQAWSRNQPAAQALSA